MNCLSTSSATVTRVQSFCFLQQAKELQMLYNLRKVFIQDLGARIKNVRTEAVSQLCVCPTRVLSFLYAP